MLAAGGLHIIGTERHESRRVDNQLRGRSGRQGDPGSSRFYLSLEDDLMRIFGSDRLQNIMRGSAWKRACRSSTAWSRASIERAQKQVEGRNFETRKHLLEYDDVMNRQREEIYGMRRGILAGELGARARPRPRRDDPRLRPRAPPHRGEGPAGVGSRRLRRRPAASTSA